MAGTSLVGTGLMLAFADDIEPTWGDVALGGISGLYGIYQGAGFALLGDGSDRQALGAMMLGGALGSLTGLVLGPYIHLDATDVLMLSAGSAWGVWLGIWTTAVLERSVGDRNLFEVGLGATAIATDAALMLTSIAVSQLVEMEPLRFAWISIFGGVGLLGGVTVGELAFAEYAHGLLWGTVAGLAMGTVITGIFDLPGMGEPTAAEAPPPSEASGSLGELLPGVDAWMPSVQVLPPDETTTAQRILFTVTGLF
jgi:hypothetical protein